MGLRPSMLDDLGLQPALAWQARVSGGAACRWTCTWTATSNITDSHRTCVYRVVQEALTNCASIQPRRYAVRRSGDRLETMRDNGVGITRPRPSGSA
jgi:signal transduction histidine kinase